MEPEKSNFFNQPDRSGRLLAGLLVVIVGIMLLLDRADIVDLPYYFFRWEMILIGLGLFVGFKHRFRNSSWLILVIIGSVFLIDDVFPEISFRQFFWPIIFIIGGIWLILTPGKNYRRGWEKWKKNYNSTDDESQDDFINSNTVFGGIKKNIISKSFKGGQVSTTFGGTELNLMQADFEGRIVIEISTAFGGTVLIVPPHWIVKSELTAILGGVEDKRPISRDAATGDKVLVLKGSVVLGGIDIKSY